MPGERCGDFGRSATVPRQRYIRADSKEEKGDDDDDAKVRWKLRRALDGTTDTARIRARRSFLLHGEAPRPLSSRGFVLGEVVLVQGTGFGGERIVRVGVRQQQQYGEQHLGDGERRTEGIAQDIDADSSVRVHVRVEYCVARRVDGDK